MTLADQIIEHGPYAGGDPSPFVNLDYTDLNRLRDELIAGRRRATYQEWRVTGTWKSGIQPKILWREADGDTEAEVLGYLEWARNAEWTDGPHPQKRTVTATDWEDA